MSTTAPITARKPFPSRGPASDGRSSKGPRASRLAGRGSYPAMVGGACVLTVFAGMYATTQERYDAGERGRKSTIMRRSSRTAHSSSNGSEMGDPFRRRSRAPRKGPGVVPSAG
jgi:hypothetical protein